MGSRDIPDFVKKKMKAEVQNKNGQQPSIPIPEFIKKKEPEETGGENLVTGTEEIVPSQSTSTSEGQETINNIFSFGSYRKKKEPFPANLKPLIAAKNAEQQVEANKFIENNVKQSLSNSGINPIQLQNNSYADDLLNTLVTKKKAELDELEKRYPEKPLYSDLAGTHYKRENSGEYSQKKEEIENIYNELNNQIGLSKAFDFAKKNPTAAPIEIGEEWLKYAQPDTYTLWQKAGKKGAIDRDMAEVGVRALYASGLPGTKELAAADEARLDYKYPDKKIAEVYHKLGGILYKKENWFLNAAPSVKQLDEAAEQLSPEDQKFYQDFIRERERKNIGTEVPMPGLVNKIGEGFTSTAEETWKGIGDLLGLRSEKRVAQEALNEGEDTRYQDVGTYAPAVARLKELNAKQKESKQLSAEEIIEKQDLESYAGVRSKAQEIIDGTGNLTGQVLFQALATKGLTGGLSAITKSAGLLKTAIPLATSTEEAIAAQALDFGISKKVITDVSASAIAYASSYDAAKREALKLMPDDKDADKRTLYSTIVAGLNAGTERIFKDEKILDAFNAEISPNVKSLVIKLNNGKITKEALSSEITKILNKSKAFIKEAGTSNLKESTEEFASSVGTSVATSILVPAKFNSQDAYNDAVSTFTTTFLYGGLVASAASVNSYKANHISIPTISQLGINEQLTNDTKNFINGQLLSGNMSQQEANDKFQILNTAVKINTEVMPQVASLNPSLPQKTKEKYSVQVLNERILRKQADESSDEVLKSALEKKIKESENIRKQLIEGDLLVDDDYSVKTPEQINQEQVMAEDHPSEQTEEDIYDELGKDKAEEAATTLKEYLDNDLFSENTEQADKDFAKEEPLKFLKTVATQAQVPLVFEGKPISAREGVVNKYGEEVVKLSESIFPNIQTQENGNEETSKEGSQKRGEESRSQKSSQEGEGQGLRSNVTQEGVVKNIAQATPIFKKLSQADKSKISKKEKQSAINKVAAEFGEQGKEAAFIHNNFAAIVKQLKDNNKIEVKC